jgi:ATP-dependent DNA helicase RecG
MNNPELILPTSYRETEVVEIEGKKVIYIYVPESSQPHSYKGIYYDRNEEGDFRLMNRSIITNLYMRKQGGYTEDKVFPYMRMEDFDPEDFERVKKTVSLRNNNKHPWGNMSNEDILRSARMYLRDERTGEEGYTLAAALVFGKVNTIVSVCGHYKIDALCRKEDVERYDDRDVIDCNLIQAYDRLMAFVRKHTPDRFFLEGIQRISIRDIIFREMIANLLVHREYSNPYPARLTIYKETVVTENWNIPYTMGHITPENLKPHAKNPNIANFFRQLGWVEELGSGVRKMFHYCPLYLKDRNALPVMEEDDVFKVTIRYEKEDSKGISKSETPDVKYADSVLELIHGNPKITVAGMAQYLATSKSTIERTLAKLVEEKIIERRGARKDGEWTIREMDDTLK